MLRRGQGDGRRVAAVTPRSLRGDDLHLLAVPHFASSGLRHRLLDLRHATERSIVLIFVAMQTMPLIFAHANGFSCLGADLPVGTSRGVGLAIATRWAEHALQAASSVFLVGEYLNGARLFAAPILYQPHRDETVRAPAERRACLRAGTCWAWCTIAALAGCLAYDPCGRAAAACAAMRGSVKALPDSAIFGHSRLTSFSLGSIASAPLVDSPD